MWSTMHFITNQHICLDNHSLLPLLAYHSFSYTHISYFNDLSHCFNHHKTQSTSKKKLEKLSHHTVRYSNTKEIMFVCGTWITFYLIKHHHNCSKDPFFPWLEAFHNRTSSHTSNFNALSYCLQPSHDKKYNSEPVLNALRHTTPN